MAVPPPSKHDITTIFKRLRSIPTNKICFDCGTNNPTWSSVTYGVFICIDCSAVHRSLGVHLTFVRSTQLDTNWTWMQLRAMQRGGNANATAFFRQHNCTTTDAQQKYKSRAASLYREKLHQLATAAMKSYGSELHLDHNAADHNPSSPVKKEIDFFKEHSDAALFSNQQDVDQGYALRNGNIPCNNINNSEEGPNVEAVLSTSPTETIKTQEIRKSTIGSRKPPQNKKAGLGARKGLGAQKVKTNFSDIEKEAQLADKRKEEYELNQKIQQKLTQEEEDKQMASVRLAYKDLSLERQKQEEKIIRNDPKKAEQFERLGMGFGGRSGVGHSVTSQMKTIDQETPASAKFSSKFNEDKYSSRNSFEDEFEFLGMTSGPPKYNDSPFSKVKDDSLSFKSEISSSKNFSTYNDRSSSRKSSNIPSSNSSDAAQKKFGNAKAISSDQYFGDRGNSDYERQANLAKFQGSNSISSSDYFGEPRKPNKNYDFNAPNLNEIKDGVKDGVNRVAGKLSNMASGVMSSFHDRYGY